MKTIGNWISEQKKYFRWWKEHQKEIVARTRAHSIRATAFYSLTFAGIIILVIVKPPFEWAIICMVGLGINMVVSLWWLAKRDSEVIKQLKKETNYTANH